MTQSVDGILKKDSLEPSDDNEDGDQQVNNRIFDLKSLHVEARLNNCSESNGKENPITVQRGRSSRTDHNLIAFGLQVVPFVFLSGLGMLAAGTLLDIVQVLYQTNVSH